MIKRILGVACLAAALLAPPSYADFNAGLDAYEKGDYTTALKEWTTLAEQGNAFVQYIIGTMYANGQGVRQDDQKAVEWFTKAALQGVANAQNSLGAMYAEGRGVQQDDQKAVEWYTKATLQGNADAQFNLGVMYFNGDGVRQSDAIAKEWFGKACDNGLQEGCKKYARLNKR